MSGAETSGAPAAHATSTSELAKAVEWLAIQQPSFSVKFKAKLKRRVRVLRAWYFFPGRVDVTFFPGHYGPLLAQSIPGAPTVLSNEPYAEYFPGDSNDMRTAAELTRDERQAILVAAASALQARGRVFYDCKAHVGWGCTAVPVIVRWEWPGVFVVVDRKSGQVIGRTLPGRPDEFEGDASAQGAVE